MAITLHGLAKALDLDHSTVAYALSGKGSIKAATRQRVREAAARLGYVANGAARRMRVRSTQCIGLAAGGLSASNAELFQQIVTSAEQRGYRVEIALSAAGSDQKERAIRALLESRVDGILLIGGPRRWADLPESHAIRHAVKQRVPIVSFGHAITGSPISAFELPLMRQSQMLTEHLVQTGRRRFAWLLPAPPPFGPQHVLCVEGTAAVLRAAGLSPRDLRVISAEKGIEPDTPLPTLGRRLMRRAMLSDNPPTAVLCPDDHTAIGAIQAAQAMGLRVGHDVAVAATGRGAAAELSGASLTTCDTPPSEAAAGVVELLLRCVRRQPDHPVTVTGTPKLILGDSTKT